MLLDTFNYRNRAANPRTNSAQAFRGSAQNRDFLLTVLVFSTRLARMLCEHCRCLAAASLVQKEFPCEPLLVRCASMVFALYVI
jgi:hypothetical protein